MTNPSLTKWSWFIGALFWVAACSAGNAKTGGEASNGGGGTTSSQGGDMTPGATGGSGGQPLSLDGGGGTAPELNATLQGTVYAPEGTIPISGALVYFADLPPDPIPQKVYCDKCIDVEGKPYTLSAADGSFSFDAPAEEGWLVVQKGAFRLARFMKPTEGANAVPKVFTTLPSKAGPYEDIPRIAVVGDAFDGVENTLAKLGLGKVDEWGEVIYGTESFDLYNEGDGNEPDGEELLLDYAKLSQYHIVFFPCEDWYHTLIEQPKVSENLKKFVETGGRIYATDWSYDVLNIPFPEPVQWLNESNELGSATVSVYDAPVASLDQGLESWLAAQAIGKFEVVDNFTIIEKLHDYMAPDENGDMTLMTPKTWVSANIEGQGVRPSTVTFQYGCGRAMFSTYHTEGEEDLGLMPQERALLYVILEVAVCLGEIPPPPK